MKQYDVTIHGKQNKAGIALPVRYGKVVFVEDLRVWLKKIKPKSHPPNTSNVPFNVYDEISYIEGYANGIEIGFIELEERLLTLLSDRGGDGIASSASPVHKDCLETAIPRKKEAGK